MTIDQALEIAYSSAFGVARAVACETLAKEVERLRAELTEVRSTAVNAWPDDVDRLVVFGRGVIVTDASDEEILENYCPSYGDIVAVHRLRSSARGVPHDVLLTAVGGDDDIA